MVLVSLQQIHKNKKVILSVTPCIFLLFNLQWYEWTSNLFLLWKSIKEIPQVNNKRQDNMTSVGSPLNEPWTTKPAIGKVLSPWRHRTQHNLETVFLHSWWRHGAAWDDQGRRHVTSTGQMFPFWTEPGWLAWQRGIKITRSRCVVYREDSV